MIQSTEQLNQLIHSFDGASSIGVDTEADSLHSYPERLCLIQISTLRGAALIDPLSNLDLRSLFEWLSGRELIFHAADYDLRLLYRRYRFRPTSVFDTMWAARLIGMNEFGLHRLVKSFVGVELEKGLQRAPWGRRPLTPRMEDYAINDVRHLFEISNQLRGTLERLGREFWHRETCDRVIRESARYEAPDPDRIWRVKGSFGLDRRELAHLRALWHWREGEARKTGRPPFFVLDHDSLLKLARRAAARVSWDSPARQLSAARRREIAAVIRETSQLSPTLWPEKIRFQRRYASTEEKRRLDRLRARRDQVAARLGLDPTLIASRAMLSLLAQDWDQHCGQLMRWQRELLTEGR